MPQSPDDLEVPAFLLRPPDKRKHHEIRAAADAAVSTINFHNRTMGGPMGTKADQIRALRESTATTGEPMPKAKKAEAVKTAKETVVQATEKSEIKAAEADKAKAENPPPQDDAAKQEKTMLKRATITKTATPTKAKPSTARKSSAKSKASANARKPIEVKAPSGMAEKIGKLASRPNGASRAELIELSGWKQQAWKWYFINSKDNGFCQRFGYKLDVIDGKDGETRYKITKK